MYRLQFSQDIIVNFQLRNSSRYGCFVLALLASLLLANEMIWASRVAELMQPWHEGENKEQTPGRTSTLGKAAITVSKLHHIEVPKHLNVGVAVGLMNQNFFSCNCWPIINFKRAKYTNAGREERGVSSSKVQSRNDNNLDCSDKHEPDRNANGIAFHGNIDDVR